MRRLAILELVLWLLSVQLAWAERLAKPGSTHPSFPMDAFAKPTFQLIFDSAHPISNRTALDMLRQYGQGQAASMSSTSEGTGLGEYISEDINESQRRLEQGPISVYLHRSSPSTLHLCSVPHPKPKIGTALHLNESSLKDHRNRIVENALKLLEPLKKNCIYHAMDWFTYSLCYGDAIRQFRALPMAVGGSMVPAMDTTQDSYVLGRWNDKIEAFKERETASTTDLQASVQVNSQHQGSDLMELVHFSSLGSSDGDQGKQEDNQLQSQPTVEGKGRYISQIWTDGTRCNINNELRTTEVQFHCSKIPARDRIVVIKEVTTCNYVVVVNTPRLCEEPALAQMEDEVREVRCQPILSDMELEQMRKKAVTIEADGGSTSKASSAPKEETTPAKQQEAEARKEVMQKSKDEVRASIEGIVSRINLAAGDSNVDLAVNIEWDEEGKFIIAPKANQPANDQVDADASKANEIQKSKWEILIEKLQELEDEIYEAADVEEFYLNQNEERGAAEAIKDGVEKQNEDGDIINEKGKAKETQQATASQEDNTAPLRTNQMAREKETFGQKAERFYKAQEAQQQQEEQKQDEVSEGTGAGAQIVARVRDEL